MIESIKNNQNPKFKLAKSLLLKKNRIKNKLYTVEGIKSVNDAIEAYAKIEMIFISESFTENIDNLKSIPIYKIPDFMFEALSDTKTPQGILAVIKMKDEYFELDKNEIYIYLDTVTDPGNLGTIIRTADAAGIGGVLLSEECADLYSPKTVRASMGSFFNIKKMTGVTTEDIKNFKKSGFLFLCGALSEKTLPYDAVDYKKPTIICVGNEANGVSDEVMKLADFSIKIPIFGKAESLNVGVAAAILMYEAKRQRKS